MSFFLLSAAGSFVSDIRAKKPKTLNNKLYENGKTETGFSK